MKMQSRTLQRNTPKTVFVNPLEAIDSSESAPDFSKAEAELKAESDRLAEKTRQLDEQKKAAADAEHDRQLKEHYDLTEEAEGYRAEAARTKDEDTKVLMLRKASEVQDHADALGRKLGLFFNDPTPVEKVVESKRWAIPALQVSGLLFFIYYCYSKFFMLRAEIILQNKTQEIQSNPYGLDSIQKLFFEKLALGYNLLSVLAILAIFFPRVLLYMLPFVKSKKDFSSEFDQNLTSWQRILVTVLLVCSFLLSLAFSPKP
ncbi:hypothetical protein BWI97_07200 [Siphonobacter sp. BAB-5405]|uniref:hypothetical protein n=1 Tax=Siphonobacter sp. BAB-5405 TaxID=1864825 RepID=UPI000C803E56|nr:hypothetical protein [Siphonobacter sp. BAB-5405]PMD97409.1 hypothetical protein BWI97_07200 [Siphonobacter sp. BAB-5405]